MPSVSSTTVAGPGATPSDRRASRDRPAQAPGAGIARRGTRGAQHGPQRGAHHQPAMPRLGAVEVVPRHRVGHVDAGEVAEHRDGIAEQLVDPVVAGIQVVGVEAQQDEAGDFRQLPRRRVDHGVARQAREGVLQQARDPSEADAMLTGGRGKSARAALDGMPLILSGPEGGRLRSKSPVRLARARFDAAPCDVAARKRNVGLPQLARGTPAPGDSGRGSVQRSRAHCAGAPGARAARGTCGRQPHGLAHADRGCRAGADAAGGEHRGDRARSAAEQMI